MGHSTGAENRLNREKGGYFGDAKYAKEELVAELASALSAANLCIPSSIRDENAQYLKNWLGALRQEPKFILTVLSDVHKASDMINKVVEQEAAKVEATENVSVTKGESKTGKEQIQYSEKEDIKKISNFETGKNTSFRKDEISKDELKKIGVKLDGLSATDLKNLLNGKETKTLILKNRKGERTDGVLSLHRNVDHTVSLTVKQGQRSSKMSMKR
jgi:hypothetical protein